MSDYGVKDIKTLDGIRLRPGITPLKCPYCKQLMNLIDGDASCISAVCRGRRNSHKNYKWRYKEDE